MSGEFTVRIGWGTKEPRYNQKFTGPAKRVLHWLAASTGKVRHMRDSYTSVITRSIRISPCSLPLYAGLAALLSLPPGSAFAQLFGIGRSEIIKDARVLVGDGRTIEKTSIEIKGGRISAVGGDLKAGMFGKTYDASGKTVTPGFIDVDSRLGLLIGPTARLDATSKAFDAWDAYAADVYAEAYRNGVTTVYVGPSTGAGILGTGAVVSLSKVDARRIGTVLREEAALHINLASHQPPLTRLNTFNAVRRQFREAQDYRTAQEDYKNDLEEYEKKIKERAEKKAREEAERKGKDSSDKKSESPATGPKKDEPSGKSPPKGEPPKDSPSPTPRPAPPSPPTPSPKDDESGSDPVRREDFAPPTQPAPGTPRESTGDAARKDAREEEIKKPNEPRVDRAKEMLLKAIDRKLPVRIIAHRSEDILNALDLAEEFNLDLVLVGATEAYLVAERIARAGVPVILGPVTVPMLRTDNEWRRHVYDQAEKLESAGVRFAFGSGGSSGILSARFVFQNAQIAWSQSRISRSPLQLVTESAAAMLGLEDTGRAVKGYRADLVVWSADPSDPSARVERVYVDGKVVYDASEVAMP